MPEAKQKWSDWIKKWYLAVFVTCSAIINFFESVKAKLQNELNKFIVVPIIHFFLQNKEKYCESISSISVAYWKENIEECENIINYIYTGYVFGAFLLFSILVLNSSHIYKFCMELLANNNEARREGGRRTEEQRIETNITTQVNKNKKLANEKLAEILNNLLDALSIIELPTNIKKTSYIIRSRTNFF